MRRLFLTAALAAVAGAGMSAAPASAQSHDPSFTLRNNTGRIITELYVSMSTNRNWGRDRLGDSTLPAGASFPVRLPSGRGCEVDIKVVYGNQTSKERMNVNTCEITDLEWR